MSKYTYLLWDIDGTILDFEAAERRAIQTLFLEFGFGECSDASVSVYSEINKKYWQALERGEMTKPEILVGRFREFFSGMGIDPANAEAFNAAYQLALGDTIVFHDDALELLRSLRGGYTLAAVTNGTAIAQRKKLSRSGLDQVFEHIFISELVGVEKPNRAFFDAVFSAMDITDPSRALIIGDSFTSDILGGINAGIDTCLYDPKGSAAHPSITPTYRLHDLREIVNLL